MIFPVEDECLIVEIDRSMHLLCSVIIAVVTLVTLGFSKWALESIQKEERRGRGRTPG